METFESSIQGLRVAGASTGERDLVERIARHGREEGALLERYERFVESGPSPATRYLVNLIIEDERRHHRVLAEIAGVIAWGTLSDVPAPVPRLEEGVPDAEFVKETKRLLASERRDRADLKKLRRRLRSYTRTMWPTLIDLMLLDTQKHIRILRFILKHRIA
jgi:hypothetical protein